MGGSIGFTVREENGKEHRMCRWTNMTPWALENIGLVHKDPEWLKRLLSPWYEMVDDYKNNREEKSPMAWTYVPDAGLHPVEYGLIVVDMQKNVILSMSDYHRAACVTVISLSLEYNATRIDSTGTTLGGGSKLKEKAFKRQKPEDDHTAVTFMDFVKEGRVKKVEYYDRKKEKILSKPIKLKSVKSVVNYVADEKNAYHTFNLDMSPFEVRHFNKDLNGCQELYKTVKDLGFVLSKKEEKSWKKYLDRFDEE